LHVPVSHDIKFNCPHADCAQHIVVDVSEAGRFLRCPACGKPAQVPGDPPKSIGAGLTYKPKATEPTDAPPAAHPVWSPFKRLFVGWGVGAAVAAAVFGGLQWRANEKIPAKLGKIADEIYWHGAVRGAPVEDHVGKALLYLQDAGNDLEVWRVSLTTLERKRIASLDGLARNSDFKWLGWSPDRKRFAYFFKSRATKQQQVVVCDNQTGEVKNSFNTGQALEGVWFSDNSIVFAEIAKKLFIINLTADAKLGSAGKAGLVDLNLKGRFRSMTPVGERTLAFVERERLWTADLVSVKTNEVCRVAKGTMQDIRCVAGTGKYLFSVYETPNGTDHYIASFDTHQNNNATVVPQTTNTTAMPSWILGDAGIAYLATTSNDVSLVIETGDAATRTNLFAGAKLQSYTVGDFGSKIFAVANDADQMTRLWEYDVAQKTLRKLLAPGEGEVLRKIVAPVTASTTNATGGRVEYFMVPPVNFDPQKKYPVVFDQRGKSQIDQNAQLLANAGIYYVALAQAPTKEPVYDNDGIVAVRAALANHPNMDAERIYLAAQGAGATIAQYALDDHPGLWRGVIFVGSNTALTLPSSEVKSPGFLVVS
jgi:dipeptidyl aminopeptidase/acylaminoacyl peptidase